MPELPELEVVRERLAPRLLGREVRDVSVSPRLGFLLRTPPQELAGALRGRAFTSVWRRGKHLVLDSSAGHLVVNPMLGGRFMWTGASTRVAADTVVRFILEGGDELRLTDSAKMGRIYLVDEDGLTSVPGWAEMGPEALGITQEEWRRRLRRHPGELKNLLRNQAFVAGIGNAYSDEILHDAQLLPLRRRSSLSSDDVDRLWASTQRVLGDAIAAISAQQNYEMHKQDRSFMRVHMRGGQDCPRCGHRISELSARGEVTNFCRGCQH